jgi:hypothetical protein
MHDMPSDLLFTEDSKSIELKKKLVQRQQAALISLSCLSWYHFYKIDPNVTKQTLIIICAISLTSVSQMAIYSYLHLFTPKY